VRERQRQKTSKTREEYASYNTGTALCNSANRNQVCQILTVDSIRGFVVVFLALQRTVVVFSQPGSGL
jgi:hypothetical protein